MIKTNEQAERKYCPQAMHKDAKDVFCLGDNCMAWRFAGNADRGGYCGLAGVPFEVRTQEIRFAAKEMKE